MNSSVPSPSTVLGRVDQLAPPGTPLTTPEVADEFDCTDRTVYNRLDALVENGVLETKKVGARGRVWWRPLREHGGSEPEATAEGNDCDRARNRLRDREERLAAELAAMDQLQKISTRLIQKDDIDTLYDEILDAVITLMDADFARLQLRDPDRGDLQLLAHSGFDETTALWDWVTPESNGPCSVALETGRRVVVPDVETCEFMAGTEDRETLLDTGIRAVQSTPLVSRSGDIVGMLSTHWETPHEPSERELRSLDVLARQATDLIGQQQAKEDLRRNRELVAGQKRVLEKLVRGASLDDVLATLIRVIEEYTEGLRGSILVVQPGDERFETVIGPDLPQSYTEALEGASISSPYLGPCGKAAHVGETGVCERVENDTRWASEWRELALSNDLHGCYSTPIVGTDGEVLGSFGLYSTQPGDVVPDPNVRAVVSDIAGVAIERKRTEEELRKSEERYRELFESMTEGFCVIERVDTAPGEPVDFRCVEANPAVADQAGIDDIVGQTMREVIPEEAADWIEVYDTVVQTGEAERFERELVSDGRTLELYAFPVGDGSTERIGVIFRDITDRKRRIEALRGAHNQLRAATSAGAVGLWTWEIQEDTLIADEFVAESYGLDQETIATGAPVERFFERVHEADRDRVQTQVEQAIEDTGVLDTEYRVRNADGEVMWLVLRGEVEYDENGEAVRMYGAISDITERKKAEERERFLAELTETLQPISDPVEVQAEASRVLGEHLDADRALYTEILADGNTGVIYTDYYSDDLPSVVGEHHFDDFGEHVADAFQSGETQVIDDYATIPGLSDEERAAYHQVGIQAYVGVPLIKDDQLTAFFAVNQATPREWTDDEVALIEETAERTWAAVERAYAEQTLQQTNDGLERLTTVSRELMDASPQDITDRAAELTRTVLDVEYTALWRYNEATGEFSRHAHYTAPEIAADAIQYPDGFSERVWRSFIHDETAIENNLPGSEDEREEPHASGATLRSYTLVPLPGHGVICAGSTHAGTFDEQTIDLTKTLGATVETAWNRAAGEQRLARQNEELARLDRLNGLIREIDKALVQADSRAAIERAVCDRLAASDQYAFVWIGDRDPATETITPREWAGVDSSYVDELSIPTDDTASGRNPIAAAARTRDTQAVTDIATETRFTPLRESTLKRGVRSCLSVPLVYDDSLYGVLAIYADHFQPDERDHAVLTELGRTIAHAIAAVETRETLRTDRVVELTLQCREPNTPLCRLARQAGCTIEFEGFVRQSDGELDVFFTASGVSAEKLSAASEQVSAIRNLLCLNDQADTALFRAQMGESTLVSRMVEQDAVVRTLIIDDGTATAIVDVPHTATVREFIERLQRDAPGLELLARQTRARPLKTQSTFQAVCEECLTSKQLSALETAYFSGFFESPRKRTGQEVAASLDVSQPTFTTHLRAAQRGICDLLFAAPTTTADS